MACCTKTPDMDTTFGIRGIPPPPNVELLTKTIPYAPGMPVRREITELFNSKEHSDLKQCTLFVLALESFKAMSVDKKLSYFQVAGIHGYPEVSWDGAGPPPKDPNPNNVLPGQDPNGGYCAHNMVTFPTWHRPYMLLFEKCLWLHMIQQIDDWVNTGELGQCDTGKWREAANMWRLPYWDWAVRQKYNNEFALPDIFTHIHITINPPSGQETTYPNPFWGFVNPEKDASGEALPFGKMPPGKEHWNIKPDDSDPTTPMPWDQCSGVSRYGISSQDNKRFEGLTGVNNWGNANSRFNDYKNPNYFYNPYQQDPKRKNDWKIPGSLADSVCRMFSPCYNDTWGSFATTKWNSESETKASTGYMSLEYIHNNVHNLTGGQNLQNGGIGHMMDVPVAAFDPIFWLHHCNIDRLLAMWQAVNWDAWWDRKEPGRNNVPDPSPYAPLEPFHTTDGGNPLSYNNYWTSEMARDWTTLCYQYDTLVPPKSLICEDGNLDEAAYKRHIWEYILKTYPSTSTYVDAVMRDKSIQNEDFFGPVASSGQQWTDYIINVVYDRYALNGSSYSIEFWLGGEPNDREGAMGSPENKIGEVYSLGGLPLRRKGSSSGCGNCGSQRDKRVLSKAQVPITIPLMSQALSENYTYIKTSSRDEVEKYLREHLHWRFVQIGGTERPATDLPKTKISVWFGTGRFESSEGDDGDAAPKKPKYGSYKPVHSPTHGKAGGLRRDDEHLGEGKHDGWNFRDIDEE